MMIKTSQIVKLKSSMIYHFETISFHMNVVMQVA